MFYCLIDTFVTGRQPGHGFANTKEVLAFPSKEERDIHVKLRKEWDYSCRALLRSEAIKFAKPGWFGKYVKVDDMHGVLLTLNNDGKHWPKEMGRVYPISEL